jgi:hypothetical protein
VAAGCAAPDTSDVAALYALQELRVPHELIG